MLTRQILTFTSRLLLLAGLYTSVLSAAPQTFPLDVTPGLVDLEWKLINIGGSSTGLPFTGDCNGANPGLTINEAISASGATDAFDNAWMLFVDNAIFVAPTPVDLTGELFTAGPVVMSGLSTSMQILFPGALQAARIRAIFTNPTNAAINANVSVPVNLGSDTTTLIEQTSSGDNVLTTADRWIITSDSSITTEPVITTVIYGPGTPAVTPLSVTETVCNNSSTDGIGFSFSITVPANASRSLMFFTGLGDIQGTGNTASGAITNAAEFNSNTSIDTRLLADLGNTVRLEILNWDFATTINAAAAAAAVEEDRTFIDDFIGCSLSHRGTSDPILPLLLAFALIGLHRKRPRHLNRSHPQKNKHL